MNKITKEQVMQVLYADLDYLNTIYKKDSILGLFTYGKVNYGFAESLEDVNIVMVYLPTFDELCSQRPQEKTIIVNNHSIFIYDIRLMLKSVVMQEAIALETLFSECKILNEKYENVFNKYIYINREAFFRFDQCKFVENNMNKANNLIHKIQTEEDNLDYKNDLFEICRLRIKSELYLAGTKSEDCINLKKDYHINYLQGILNGEISVNLIEVADDFHKLYEQARPLPVNFVCDAAIRKGISEVIRVSLTEKKEKNDFLKLLTDIEKIALNAILKQLEDGEGNISISKLTQETEISRPVFKNVLNKLKTNQIAEISNMGVKGTYIRILDATFTK